MSSINSDSFTLLQEDSFPSIFSTGCWYRHISGMEIFCLQNEDCENLFALGFFTPPSDSTGVPHIIEHTVLSGSQKFPLKDPFIGLIQSSLATFINAMTYSDRTLFPVSSCNHQDLFNLAEVYWDAVFHPRLLKESFEQEGWHYELKKDARGKEILSCNGIVLNEMKGAYADLESVYERGIYKHLMPDTCLSNDSGGNPEFICTLSYKQFLHYYHKHYSLSNAKLLFYGNIPLADKLAFVEKQLELDNDIIPAVSTSIRTKRMSDKLQSDWIAPKSATEYFSTNFKTPNSKNAAFACAWKMGLRPAPIEDLALQLLDFILLGNDSSIMNKTLLEFGLGEAMLTSGYDNDYQESIFQIGMRGVRPADFQALEDLILNVLKRLYDEGIPTETVQAAFRQLRLDQSEIDSDQCLNILEDVFASWNYGNRNPFIFLRKQTHFDQLSEKLTREPLYLKQLIQRCFLSNPHRLSLRMLPQSDLQEKEMAKERQRMMKLQLQLSPEELEKIRENQKKLKQFQIAPDRPEDFQKLPRLKKQDLLPKTMPLPVEEVALNNGQMLQRGKIATNGVAYLNLAFDLKEFPQRFFSKLQLFVYLFNKVGTTGHHYDVMANQMAAEAMTIKLSVYTNYFSTDTSRHCGVLVLSLKTLKECLPKSLELLREQWQKKTFCENKRVRELLKQHWSQLKNEIVQSGQVLASARASVGLTPFADLNDAMRGVEYVQYSHKAGSFAPSDFLEFQESMDGIAAWFAEKLPLNAAYSGCDKGLENVLAWLNEYSEKDFLNAGNFVYERPWPEAFQFVGRREIIPLNNGGTYCARVLQAPHITHSCSASLAVYSQLLSCGYLWNEIRMQGSAYGVQCQYQPFSQLMNLMTSEDPSPNRSFDIFSLLPGLNFSQLWTDADIDGAIIACTKGDDRPWRPWQVTSEALMNQLYGYTEEMRQKKRDALLSLTRKKLVADVAFFWQEYSNKYNDCLVGAAKFAKKRNFSVCRLSK